jgi:uncharacterized protein (DUF1778 family)
MARPKTTARHPLSMRLPQTDVELIDRAAKQQGRHRTEFVRDAAVRAAELVLLESALQRMSPGGFASFARAIAGPGRPARQLVKVLQRKAPWE